MTGLPTSFLKNWRGNDAKARSGSFPKNWPIEVLQICNLWIVFFRFLEKGTLRRLDLIQVLQICNSRSASFLGNCPIEVLQVCNTWIGFEGYLLFVGQVSQICESSIGQFLKKLGSIGQFL